MLLFLNLVSVGAVQVTIRNNCVDMMWADFPVNDASPDSVRSEPIFSLAPGESRGVGVEGDGAGWSSAAVFFAKGPTGCTTRPGGGFACSRGLNLAEWTYTASGELFYDLSNVDGIQFDVRMEPVDSPDERGSCQSTECIFPQEACPGKFYDAVRNRCLSGCLQCVLEFQTTDGPCRNLCCPGVSSSECLAAGEQQNTLYAYASKCYCPNAYAFSYDDSTSTFVCNPGTSLAITLCPAPSPGPYAFDSNPQGAAATGTCTRDPSGGFSDYRDCAEECVRTRTGSQDPVTTNNPMTSMTSVPSSTSTSFAPSGGGRIGVNFGLIGIDPIPWAEALMLLKIQGVDTLKTYSITPEWLEEVEKIFGNSVRVQVAVPNGELASAADDAAYRSWLVDQLIRFQEIIEFVAVGNEPFASFNRALAMPRLADAFKAVVDLIESNGLAHTMKATIPWSAEILVDTYPVENSRMNPDILETMMDLLPLHREHDTLFSITLYPYFAYAFNSVIPLDFALGQDGSLYLAMVRGTKIALEKLGYGDLGLIVAETGWPTAAGKDTSSANALLYNSHVVEEAKSGHLTDIVYLFEAFDELGKPGPAVEEHWGIWEEGGASKYSLDLSNFVTTTGVPNTSSSSTAPPPSTPTSVPTTISTSSSSTSSVSTSPSSSSGIPVPPCSQWNWRFYDYEYEIVGHDIGYAHADNRNECQPLCYFNPECLGYTWVPCFGGRCFFKGYSASHHDVAIAEGAFSGIRC